MCGVAGIFRYRTSGLNVDKDELLRIREDMVNRGPDGSGIWFSEDRRVGLAHRRLSVIDLSNAASQPMATEDGRLCITFNGEIYNYRELRKRLEKKGYRFHTNSDTEVLLHLYDDRGRSMVHDLRGMYAFALWDERRRGLFLARDPFGIKPIYYSDDGNTFRFASQVKALLKSRNINTTEEPAGHVGFFLFGYVPEPYTLYRSVRALPSGTSLWLDENGKKEFKKFFSVTDELIEVEKTASEANIDEIRKRLREALLDTVNHHLVADVPVGIFLSSGLDSTTLSALVSEVKPKELYTITLGFQEYNGTHNDETSLAEVVAHHYGAVHQTKWVSRDGFLAEKERLFEVMDQPSIDGVNTYFVSKVAAQAGLKVALSGLGGDELFGGYPSFMQVPKLVNALGPLCHFPSLGKGFRWVSTPITKYCTSPKYAGLLEYGGSYSGAYLLRRGLFMPWELPEIMDGEMAREGWKELQPLIRLEETIRGISKKYLKISALEMSWYMRNQLLRDADWAGMAHSLEIRVPFVDIELFRSVAPLLPVKHPPTKLDMADCPAKPLPDEILNRQKTGFSVPVREWLLQSEPINIAQRGLRGWALKVYKSFRGGV
ncbi:MAG: asparagine synthase (glutamine-hydrolyzing) [Ignavibacteriaceae bacterium]